MRKALDPEGLVFVHGELWRARVRRRADRAPDRRSCVERIEDELVSMIHVRRVEASEPVTA